MDKTCSVCGAQTSITDESSGKCLCVCACMWCMLCVMLIFIAKCALIGIS